MKIKFIFIAFIGLAVQMITSKGIQRGRGIQNASLDNSARSNANSGAVRVGGGSCCRPKCNTKPPIGVCRTCPQKPSISCPEKPDISCPEKPDISCPERCDSDCDDTCDRCQIDDCNC